VFFVDVKLTVFVGGRLNSPMKSTPAWSLAVRASSGLCVDRGITACGGIDTRKNWLGY
jgi:hypothetical protein